MVVAGLSSYEWDAVVMRERRASGGEGAMRMAPTCTRRYKEPRDKARRADGSDPERSTADQRSTANAIRAPEPPGARRDQGKTPLPGSRRPVYDLFGDHVHRRIHRRIAALLF
jgi:hypothetical protein